MQEIIKSIKAFLYDRTVSPLFGAFAVAWFVWNYRVVIVALDGDATLTEKLSFFDAYFADDHLFQLAGFTFHVWGGGHLVHGFLMPMFFTWAYLYIYPKLAKPVFQHSLKKQIELKAIKQEAENSRLLTAEESRTLQKEIEQLRFRADEEASQYRTRISSLTQTINELEKAAHKSETYPNTINSEMQLNPPLPTEHSSREPSEALITKIKSAIFTIYPMVKSSAIDSEFDNLITGVARYFSTHDMSISMFRILCVLVATGGGASRNNLFAGLQDEMSLLEVDHELNKLRTSNLVFVRADGQHALTENGLAVAVESGLTAIDRKIRSARTD